MIVEKIIPLIVALAILISIVMVFVNNYSVRNLNDRVEELEHELEERKNK